MGHCNEIDICLDKSTKLYIKKIKKKIKNPIFFFIKLSNAVKTKDFFPKKIFND